MAEIIFSTLMIDLNLPQNVADGSDRDSRHCPLGLSGTDEK
jgi:hypothetical protein